MSGRKLGRGLDMLINKKTARQPAVEEVPAEQPLPDPPVEEVALVKVVDIDPNAVETNPEQPRKDFDDKELEMLKSSISREGLLQPVLVRKAGDRLQLIAGERRLRASRELGLARIPAIVTELEDDRLLEVALIENIQRADLNPVEVGRAYQQLMKVKGWTQEALAKALGVSRSSVANSLRLLELPDEMQSALVRQHITAGHAKVLLSVDDREEQRKLFERIAEERLSVRELEAAKVGSTELTSHEDAPSSEPTRAAPRKRSARIVGLEEELSRAVGTRVSITESGRSGKKGRIGIEFYSTDDFERIRSLLLGK